MVHLISLPQLLKLAGKLCYMVPNNGLNYTSDSVNLILYLFLVSSMLMYAQTVAIWQRPTQFSQTNSALTMWYRKITLLQCQSSPSGCALLSCLNNEVLKV